MLSEDKKIFINCPFDDQYQEMFDAMLFTVFECGFLPVSAKDIKDSSLNRLEKIFDMIGECQYSINDISRTESNNENLPRFNMPLELGIFLGAKRYGRKHKNKRALIVDSEKFRYPKFISDISGQDIDAHEDNPMVLIKIIRNWIKSQITYPIPGAKEIQRQYKKFEELKPTLMEEMKLLDIEDVTHSDYLQMLEAWQQID